MSSSVIGNEDTTSAPGLARSAATGHRWPVRERTSDGLVITSLPTPAGADRKTKPMWGEGDEMDAVVRLDTPMRQAARFAWHFVQMFIAMMLGMLPLFVVLGLLGIYDLSKRQPELFASLMALSMVLPMAAWMRFRMGHGWSRTSEMSVAMIAPTLVIVPLCLAGVLPHRAAVGASHVLMPLAMLADMGYRWRDYARHPHAAMVRRAKEAAQPMHEAVR